MKCDKEYIYCYRCSCAGREHTLEINAKNKEIAESLLVDMTRFPADWELFEIIENDITIHTV